MRSSASSTSRAPASDTISSKPLFPAKKPDGGPSQTSALAWRQGARWNNEIQMARRNAGTGEAIDRLGNDAPGDDLGQLAFLFWRAREQEQLGQPAQCLAAGADVGVGGMLEDCGRGHGSHPDRHNAVII